MYLRLFTLVCCLCFGGITAVSAQDQINLLNGQQLAVKVLEVQDSLVHYEYVKRKDKVREEYMRDFRIFSLVQEGKETVFYEQDSAKGNPLAIDEMRNFIQGERDALNGYKPVRGWIIGGVLGALGGYALGEGFFVVTVPVGATVVGSLTSVRIPIDSVSDPDLLDDPNYLDGYTRVAKSKKVFGVLKGSIVGAVAGALLRHATTSSN